MPLQDARQGDAAVLGRQLDGAADKVVRLGLDLLEQRRRPVDAEAARRHVARAHAEEEERLGQLDAAGVARVARLDLGDGQDEPHERVERHRRQRQRGQEDPVRDLAQRVVVPANVVDMLRRNAGKMGRVVRCAQGRQARTGHARKGCRRGEGTGMVMPSTSAWKARIRCVRTPGNPCVMAACRLGRGDAKRP